MARKRLNIDACPARSDLEAYASKLLIGRRNEEVFLHLKHCGKCLRQMAALTSVPSPERIIQGGQGRKRWQQRLLAWWPFRSR